MNSYKIKFIQKDARYAEICQKSRVYPTVNFAKNAQLLTAFLLSIFYFLSLLVQPIVLATPQKNSYINNFGVKHNFTINSAKNFTLAEQNLFAQTKIVTYVTAADTMARQIDNNELQSYVFDRKGSVLKLQNTKNDNTVKYAYDAYGKSINTTNFTVKQDTPNPFQYNGERSDNNTNLQYLTARFYNSDTRRFITKDSSDLLNRYNYANNNPVSNTDPSGHNAWDILGIASGFLMSGFATLPGKHTKRFAIGGAAIGAGIAAAGNFVAGNYYAAAGNFLNGIGTIGGMWSAQPDYFEHGENYERLCKKKEEFVKNDEISRDLPFHNNESISAPLAENEEQLSRATKHKDLVNTISSTFASIMNGAGAGLINFQNSNHDWVSALRYIGGGAAAGAFGGWLYGKMSKKMDASTDLRLASGFGAGRTFAAAVVSALSTIGNSIYNSVASDSHYDIVPLMENLGVSLLLGAVSGFLQIKVARSMARPGEYCSWLWSTGRASYLNLKGIITPLILSGTFIAAFGNFKLN